MKKDKTKEIIKIIYPYVIIIVVVLLIKNFIVAPIQVNGDSMYDTLYDKDIMILNKIGYRFSSIKRFDIVVIDYNNRLLIKRVIGLPGETVKIKDNNLYINDELVEQPFLDSSVVTGDYQLEEKIPDGYYFVMGDNRKVSLDSRTLGLFSREKIQGKASLTIFPFSRFGIKK